MNEISIIINGVRYDAVEQDTFVGCFGCDIQTIEHFNKVMDLMEIDFRL